MRTISEGLARYSASSGLSDAGGRRGDDHAGNASGGYGSSDSGGDDRGGIYGPDVMDRQTAMETNDKGRPTEAAREAMARIAAKEKSAADAAKAEQDKLIADGEARRMRQEAAVQMASATADRIVKEAQDAAAAAKATGIGVTTGATVGGVLLGPFGAKIGSMFGGWTEKQIAQENAINSVADKYGVEFGGDPTTDTIGNRTGGAILRDFQGDDPGTTKNADKIVGNMIGASVGQAKTADIITADPQIQTINVAPPAKDMGLPLLAGGILAVKLLLL